MMKAKIFAPVFLIPLVVATVTGGIQNVWAAGTTTVLLSPESPTWHTTSSGYKSPDGKWIVVHPGYGSVQVVSDHSNKVLELAPKLSDSSRHSALVLSTVDMTGIHGKMQVRLDQQSSNPKSWDSFWAMLAYVDQTTHISLLIKTNGGGWEISKRDHDHADQDLHEARATGHSIPSAVKGHWYNVEWWIAPNHDTHRLHIKVVVDGKVLADKDDSGHYDRDGHKGSGTSSYFLNSSSKSFAAYSEKSHTSWKNISVQSM